MLAIKGINYLLGQQKIDSFYCLVNVRVLRICKNKFHYGIRKIEVTVVNITVTVIRTITISLSVRFVRNLPFFLFLRILNSYLDLFLIFSCFFFLVRRGL